MREAFLWTVFWVSLALLFNVGIWLWSPEKGIEFLTGYLIEESLSVDNLFVFLVIFSYFSVPTNCRYIVLFWGVLGAIVFRIIFILAGTALLNAFHWCIYLFGAILIITAIKLLRTSEEASALDKKWVLRFARRFLPLTPRYHGQHFWMRENKKLLFTPLFLAVIVTEATDIFFAIDSIPAIFAVTRDPFIVYTSNIFAVLGLRSIFFLIAGSLERFCYLKYGLCAVLGCVGVKMIASDAYHIPTGVSLAVIVMLIGISILASLIKTK